MRIAICDDEKVQYELLKKYILEWGCGKAISTVHFSSAESFLFAWEDDKAYDLLILDIEMGKMSGMELAMRLRKAGQDIPLLFVTGYESYMAQGFEVEALHYLLKPVHKEKLFAVLNRVTEKKQEENKLLFCSSSGMFAIEPSRIKYVEAQAHQCILTGELVKETLKLSISEVKEMLVKTPEPFMCCHRSFIINLTHIAALIDSEAVMDDNMRIPISRSMKKKVQEALGEFYRKGRG